MSDGRKAAYEDEMEQWMVTKVKKLQSKNMGIVIQDLKSALDMLDDLYATDPVLTSANHYRLAAVRKTIREILS